MAKDYYNILGVAKDASPEEIKKAFRKLAHQHHPDKEGGDEAKFKELNEAYQVLSDTKKRQAYDQFGEAGVNGQGGFSGGGAGFSGINWEDMMRQSGNSGGPGVEFDLGDILGDFFGNGRRRGSRQKQGGQDIQMDMEIDFIEAVFGIKKTVELYKTEKCGHCHGNGAEPGTPIKECKTCQGKGTVSQVRQTMIGNIRTQAVCPGCQGEGKIAEKKCAQCQGGGVEKKQVQIEVSIPAGIDSGQTIRLEGKGEAGLYGSASGNLYLNIYVRKSAEFERQEDNVLSTIKVPYEIFVLGGKVTVKTLDGEAEMKVPSGTESGKLMRLRNKGIPHLQASGRGDHLVKLEVDIPKHPGRKYKKLLKELSEFSE